MIFEVICTSFSYTGVEVWEKYPLLLNKYKTKKLTYKSLVDSKTNITILTIEIDTIEDLLEMKKDFGEIILCSQYEGCNSPIKNVIEIYDDYRE